MHIYVVWYPLKFGKKEKLSLTVNKKKTLAKQQKEWLNRKNKEKRVVLHVHS